jgi:serine/threonine protein kinase
MEQGRKTVNWKQRIPHASDQAIDLLKQLLAFNPEKRITVDDAINHPYFENLRKLDNNLPRCTSVFDWSWEAKMQKESEKHKNPYFDKQMICRLIYNESLDFHPEKELPAPAKEGAENEIKQLPVPEDGNTKKTEEAEAEKDHSNLYGNHPETNEEQFNVPKTKASPLTESNQNSNSNANTPI